VSGANSEGPGPDPKPVFRLSQKACHERHRTGFTGPLTDSPHLPHQPGEEIRLGEDRGLLVTLQERIQAEFSSKVVFSPGPHSVVSATSSGRAYSADSGWVSGIQINATNEAYEVLTRSIRVASKRDGTTTYTAEFSVQRSGPPPRPPAFKTVRFHLVNFPRFWWKAGAASGDIRPISATFGPWHLILYDGNVKEEIRRESANSKSYVVTHIGTLQRTDRAAFGPAEWEPVSEFLYWHLALCAGLRCGPFLVEGLNRNRRVVWRDMAVPTLGRDRHHLHWFPRPYPTHISSLFASAWSRWQDEDLREAITLSVGWFLEARDSGAAIHTRLILSQVALELLSWVIMVEMGGHVSASGFKCLPASDRIALLANQLRASPAIPSTYSDLLAEAAARNWISAPQALTEIRNRIIHPEKKSRGVMTTLDWRVIYQAAEWGCWLVELGILSLLGYEGRYDSRVAESGAGFPFVPWIDPIQGPAPVGSSA